MSDHASLDAGHRRGLMLQPIIACLHAPYDAASRGCNGTAFNCALGPVALRMIEKPKLGPPGSDICQLIGLKITVLLLLQGLLSSVKFVGRRARRTHPPIGGGELRHCEYA